MLQLWLFGSGIVQLHCIPFLSKIFLRKNNLLVESEPEREVAFYVLSACSSVIFVIFFYVS